MIEARLRRARRPVGRAARALPMLLGLLLTARASGAAPFGYVVNHGDGTVTVVDTATNAVATTVVVGSEPLGAAVTPDGTRVFVTNQTAPIGSVSVIDTALNGVVATVTAGIGARPSGVAVRLPGDRAYVTNRDDKNVSVVDVATNTVVATVPVGNNPLGIAVDPAGSPAYVVNKGSNSVTVIDTVANAVVATIPVGNDPSHVAVAPNGRRVYVSNTSNASVSVIDTGLQSVVATVAVGNIPEGVAVDPTGARLYVANSGPNSVSVVDTSTHAVLTTIPVGMTPFELALRPDGARLYVANRQGASVSVIDTTTSVVATTIPAGFGPAGFGQFIAPALRIPVFDPLARKCQAAITRQGVKLVKLHHGLEVACRLAVVRAEAAGKGTAKAEAACLRTLDPNAPSSRLARARARTRAAIERSCAGTQPAQVHTPCTRGAASFGAIADCLIGQHATHVAAMIANEFSAARPTPLTGDAIGCQSALAKRARRFADRLHQDLGACLEQLLKAAGTGRSDAKAAAACRGKLDLANPLAKAPLARVAALAAVAKKCAGVAPAALGSPCDPAAPTIAAATACVLDRHVAAVGHLVAAEHNDACVMLTRSGLGTGHRTVCSGVR